MPTSARKSSMGLNRRGPQKYIPYRADDLQHGKRTGLAVGMIEHDSDGFEPFEKLMGQADLRTPPKPKVQSKRRRPKAPVVVEEEDEDDGEMSMDLVDSNPNSPATYFSQARVASITSSVQRVGSSSRPVQRLSDVDFDKVPSPRYSTPGVARRTSLGFGLSSGRPSHLAYSSRGDDFEEESEGGFEAPPFEAGFDDHELPASDIETDQERTPVPQRKHSLASTRKSFANLSRAEEDEPEQQQYDEDMQVDEDQEEEEEVERRVSGKQAKAKGRMRVVEEEPEPQRDDDMEDEIAQGMEEIDRMPEDDFDQPMEEDGGEEPQRGQVRQRDQDDSVEKGRTKKKARKENQQEPASPKPKKSKPRKQQQTVLSEAMYDVNVDDNGLRRSKRKRYAPLDWWRCEKVVYGRRESGNQFVPTIKEIRRIPKEEVQPLGAKHRRRRKPNSKGKASVEPEPPIFWNPEEGWDDETNPMAVVTDFVTGKEAETRVAFTAGMVSLRDAANANFKFQKMFSDGSFLAAGQLLIPPEGSKPTKSTRDNSFIFYVIEGGVKVTIHRTSFIITTGGMFYVPRGNMYVIHNVSDRDARLFFAQARKVEKEELDGDREDRSPTFVNSPSR